ncbi:MAG: hypothetical protein KF866_06745 [Phycisphaeraceae bacterium]|nr:hypothetical protein [Phycisphaeraceae bacterium]
MPVTGAQRDQHSDEFSNQVDRMAEELRTPRIDAQSDQAASPQPHDEQDLLDAVDAMTAPVPGSDPDPSPSADNEEALDAQIEMMLQTAEQTADAGSPHPESGEGEPPVPAADEALTLESLNAELAEASDDLEGQIESVDGHIEHVRPHDTFAIPSHLAPPDLPKADDDNALIDDPALPTPPQPDAYMDRTSRTEIDAYVDRASPTVEDIAIDRAPPADEAPSASSTIGSSSHDSPAVATTIQTEPAPEASSTSAALDDALAARAAESLRAPQPAPVAPAAAPPNTPAQSDAPSGQPVPAHTTAAPPREVSRTLGAHTRTLGRVFAPLVKRAAALASAPLEGRPRIIRDSIGWLAIWTAFLAVCTLMATLVFRHPKTPQVETAPTTLDEADRSSGWRVVTPDNP